MVYIEFGNRKTKRRVAKALKKMGVLDDVNALNDATAIEFHFIDKGKVISYELTKFLKDKGGEDNAE